MNKQTEVVSISAKVQTLKASVEAVLAAVGTPYRRLLVSSSQKTTFKCSADCFGVKQFSFQESFDCHQKCQDPLKTIRAYQEVLLAQFDVSSS
jgi:hypothetical protein